MATRIQFPEVRYGEETPADMINSLHRGEIVQMDPSARVRSGDLVLVQFREGDYAVRRYFRFRGDHLFISEKDTDYCSPVYRYVQHACAIVGTRRDEGTSVDPELPNLPGKRCLKTLKRSLPWWHARKLESSWYGAKYV